MAIRHLSGDLVNLTHELEIAVSPTSPFVPTPFTVEMLITVENTSTGARTYYGVVKVPSRGASPFVPFTASQVFQENMVVTLNTAGAATVLSTAVTEATTGAMALYTAGGGS